MIVKLLVSIPLGSFDDAKLISDRAFISFKVRVSVSVIDG